MDAATFFLWAGGVISTGTILWTLYRIVRKFDDLFEWFAWAKPRLEELEENGGSSMKDNLARLATNFDQHLKDHENERNRVA